MHKVALSPHVISVWIKMDYWITRASTGSETATDPKKNMDSWGLQKNALLYLNIVCDILMSLITEVYLNSPLYSISIHIKQ